MKTAYHHQYVEMLAIGYAATICSGAGSVQNLKLQNLVVEKQCT
jgi:hypothetical protein